MPYRSASQRAVTPQHRGRYPGFDVLDNVDAWDDVTVGVVLARLAPPGELAFFTPHQAGIAAPLLDLLLAQDSDPRVPVLALIDARLAAGETDGWHYDDMPQDARAWRDTLRALDEEAAQHLPGGDGFARLRSDEQALLIQTVQDLATHGRTWHDLPAAHVWSLWTRYACTRVLLPPVGLERDRVPRPGLSARVSQRRCRRARALGGRRPRHRRLRRRSGPVRRPGGGGPPRARPGPSTRAPA